MLAIATNRRTEPQARGSAVLDLEMSALNVDHVSRGTLESESIGAGANGDNTEHLDCYL